ncbi:DNA repair and recombination protein RadA [Candidatus Woesearchaeota archaeon]|jgi:DNA repair protein RadA|nr:DNA repair and recombination protein RadA [Candidatus Woesearchaeota archaeon]MBT5397400.1 DNA repair and recombination protein RadA [Candidatus Woesearchaeota archaeon]MBT6367754.1 DNA repair and recombination protein RadA [Candidatus Woesearchaeota archaeon]MBT7762800.1 DNA repair and recombination protein RadA [Candidatus Woesearchaeota archaeon]
MSEEQLNGNPEMELVVEPEVKEKKSKSEMKMEKLTIQDLPGVGAATAEKLESAGYRDLMAVAVATLGELIETTGVSEAVARKMINAARDSMKMGFETGMDILKKRELVFKITTGSENFDTLMGGGFETGAITECFGEFGSGKTQIGHILAVNTLKEDPTAEVVYIDTENTFRPERITQLAEGIGLDPTEALQRIMVAKAYNSDHQMLLVEKVDGLIVEQGKKIKLLVIDSLTSHFRAEYIGRGTLAERQQKLNRHMHTLAKVGNTHNLCVYVTNQVMAKPDQFFGDPTTSIGGHIVAHASTFRIYLRKGRKGSRVAKLIDAPNLPDAECCFEVQEQGLRDIN